MAKKTSKKKKSKKGSQKPKSTETNDGVKRTTKEATAKAAEKATASIAAKANIIAQLESLSVGYDDKMEPAELQALLYEAFSKQEKPVEVPAQAGVPQHRPQYL